MEMNERMEKINYDMNRSLFYMMDNQCKMVDNVEIIKKNLMNIKSELRQPKEDAMNATNEGNEKVNTEEVTVKPVKKPDNEESVKDDSQQQKAKY